MNFEEEAAKLHRKLGIWDDRPRFLGMFLTYPVQGTPLGKAPRFGIGDHLQTCKECESSGAAPHPKIHAIFAYVRIGNLVHTVSWPTWWDEIFS